MLHFLLIESLWQSSLSTSLSTIFPTFAHFMLPHHILIFLSIFKFFHYCYICYTWWPMTGDLWYHNCNYLGAPYATPIKTANLINIIYVLTAPPTRHFPIFSLLFMTHYSLRHDNIKIRPINDLTWPLSVQLKGRVTCLSLSIRR